MREAGYSNKVFYYNGAGHSTTYDLRMRILLSTSPDREALKAAAKKTIAVFPEFAVRPVIGKDGRVYYADNDADVAIFDEDGSTHALGSDETNGYLFCLICGEKSVILSFFHGLSDYVGNWAFICTLCYHYARHMGADVRPEEPVRLSRAVYDDMDITERDDPYYKFEDENAVPLWEYVSKGAACISERLYPDNMDYLKNYEITTEVDAIIKKTKEIKTSFVPLIIVLVSRALNKIYDIKGQNCVVKIPANLRPLFGTDTFANFSDSLVLCVTEEMLDKTTKEACHILRSSMNEQFKRENFVCTFAKKINSVKAYESCGKTIEQLNRELTNAASAASARPVTFAMTYPGRLELPGEYDKVITGFNMEPYVPTNGFFLFAGSYRDVFKIRVCQRFDSDRLVRAIAAEFGEAGIMTNVTEADDVYGDKVYVDRLTHL